MRFAQIDEDRYWENVRESLEAEDPGPHKVQDSLYLDELHEEIESSYGYQVGELYEGDLIEIVEQYTKIIPEEASYDRRYDCIRFAYVEVA